MICYGVSFSAFSDYCQMGESTAKLCFNKLCHGFVKCPPISEYYLRPPLKSNVRRIVYLHKSFYGINGFLGCLDVTKIHWTACPEALEGQFEGEKGYPIIKLEAVADNNLWIWHNAFDFAGLLNDINIWHSSPLYESMLDGTHYQLDSPFVINDQQFDHLYYLIDDIYPAISRFFLPSTIRQLP